MDYDDTAPRTEPIPEEPLADPVRRALRADLDAALADPGGAWGDFGPAVMARLDEVSEDALAVEDGWAATVAAIRDDHAAALAELELEAEAFRDGVGLKLAEAEEAGAETVGAVLRAEVEAAVADKQSAWPAFQHQILARLGAGPPDDAVEALREDVEAAVDAMAPGFEGRFRDEVERKIFKSGQAQPWWRPAVDAVQRWLRPAPAWGLAAAAAAVALVVLDPSAPGPEAVVATGPVGEVSVQAIRFDGTVTVLPDDGIAVVWVADPT